MSYRIGFIGTGKMGEALIGGLISKGVFSNSEIVGCAPSEGTRRHMSETYGIEMRQDAAGVARDSDMVVLAVKPYQVAEVFGEEGFAIGGGKILISIVAGLTIAKMKAFAPDAKAVRVMPNHCCMVLEGAMGFACDKALDAADREEVGRILSSVGLAKEVPEDRMEAITGIAGSSPAFIYMVIDAMADAGVLNGLTRQASIELAAQSVLGAAKMVLETGKHPDVLRDEVCSPGGTTIVGVKTLEDFGLRAAMINAVDCTIDKAKKMAE